MQNVTVTVTDSAQSKRLEPLLNKNTAGNESKTGLCETDVVAVMQVRVTEKRVRQVEMCTY